MDQLSFVDDLASSFHLTGLAYEEGMLSSDAQRALVANVEGERLSPFRFQGWLGKRQTKSFGWNYDFDTGRFGRAEPIPRWLEPLKERAAAFAGIDPGDLVQALLIRYDPGSGIGWHRDRPVFEHVLGVSLGQPTALRLRRRKPKGFDRLSLPVAPGSLYHLSGEARHEWEHSIAPIEQTRWSITFRSLA